MMPKTIKEKVMLTKSSAQKNQNKFWEGILYDDDSLDTRWGRVGDSGQTRFVSCGGARELAKKIREKTAPRKGYKRSDIVNQTDVTVIDQKMSLKDIATSQIKTDSQTTLSLIHKLVDQNVHNILSSTKMTYDEDDGLFKTDVGVVVSSNTIAQARAQLTKIGDMLVVGDLTGREGEREVEEYCMLIPQNIGRRRFSISAIFPGKDSLLKQNGILDSLEVSIKMMEDGKALAAKPKPKTDEPMPELFNTSLMRVTDDKIISYVTDKYRKTRQGVHQSSRYDVSEVYAVEITAMKEAFESKGYQLGNVWQLWHGTQIANVLSILKGGLVVPPRNAPHCTGRMFSSGAYFSDQSTKALNYATGYWGGSRSNDCFMFLADVAMGKYYVPSGPRSTLPPTGYDSYFAKGRQSGVMNNEMIVPNVHQCDLRYLVRFA
jgi:poly [ADP-ribose] polymerase